MKKLKLIFWIIGILLVICSGSYFFGFAATLAFTTTFAPVGISEMLDFYLEGYISASKKIPDITLYSKSSIDSLKNLVSSLRQGKDCCEVEEKVYYTGYIPRGCRLFLNKR